jgi:hypothetical protein
MDDAGEHCEACAYHNRDQNRNRTVINYGTGSAKAKSYGSATLYFSILHIWKIWTMLENTVKRVPTRTALAVKRNDEWVKWTYTEYQASAVGRLSDPDPP